MKFAAVRPWLAMLAVVAVAIFAGTARSTSESAVVLEEPEAPRMLRWMLVHRPDRAYEHTAQVFAEELPRLSGGRLNIQMLPKADRYVDVPEEQVFEFVNDGLRSGDADMMTVYLKDVEAIVPELQTVNLPFVFEDYAAVEKFLESPVAE